MRILWVGDAGCETGFAKVTHHICDVLSEMHEVSVLGINYRGDPHRYSYPLYPARLGMDWAGINRLQEMIDKLQPEIIVLQNDPWNIPQYMHVIKDQVPVVGVVPVDGKNCRGVGLNELAHVIFWTKFGQSEAKLGGYKGTSSVVPLGVDTTLYRSLDRKECRKQAGFPEQFNESFMFGVVGRNQPRKRIDLAVRIFSQYCASYQDDTSVLVLHVAPTGEKCVDIRQLCEYYELRGRVILSEPPVWEGVREDLMPALYSCFDVQLTTTQGEGWGLCTMEGMACGVPQIVPDWSALGEWPEDAALKIPCTTTATTLNGINVLGGVIDESRATAAMFVLRHEPTKERYRSAGLRLVYDPRFDWRTIALEYNRILEKVLSE